MAQLWTLCIAALCLTLQCSAEFDPGELDADLKCSACTNFINDYLTQCIKHVSTSPDAALYTQRLRDIYTEHAPNKLSSVESLVRRSKGKEYELYLKVCAKYKLDPEEDDVQATGDEIFVHKRAGANNALRATIEGITKPGPQWAVIGDNGKRKYMDFNIAMKSGSMNGNINMGPDTHTQLMGSYKFWGEEHAVDITNAVARAGRVYESRLDKEFCVGIEACGPGSKEL